VLTPRELKNQVVNLHYICNTERLTKQQKHIYKAPKAAAKGRILILETFSLLFNFATSQCVNASYGST
jgi:hypothetical protein